MALSSNCNRTLKIVIVFGSRSSLVFNAFPDKPSGDIFDIIRNQWRM